MTAGRLRYSAAAVLAWTLAIVGGSTLALAPAASAQAAPTVVSDWTALTSAFSSGTPEIAVDADIIEATGGRLVLGGGASVILDLRGHIVEVGLVVAVASAEAAIYVPAGTSLTITDSVGGGQLTVKGGDRGAGIGTRTTSSGSSNGGTIAIQAGTVTATGGKSGAGIGGGSRGNGGTITITGGTVTAIGGENAAGIGGGCSCSSTDAAASHGGVITITGGTVTATGGSGGPSPSGSGGAGIGGGASPVGDESGRPGGTITIGGSAIVTATGGRFAAGIGGTQRGSGGTITIDSGTVAATGGTSGAGIGGGNYAATSAIVINGGDVTAHGGSDAAGIGSGNNAGTLPVSVTIAGGSVFAYGGSGNPGGGAGIGGGSFTSGGTITATGGTVKSYGGRAAAGIGSGYSGGSVGGTTIALTGASVEAVGGIGGAGIGSGSYADPTTVTIGAGSTVVARGAGNGAGIGGGSAAAHPAGAGSAVTINGGFVDAAGGPSGAGIGAGGGGVASNSRGTLVVNANPIAGTGTTGGSAAATWDGKAPNISGNAGTGWYSAAAGAGSVVITVGYKISFDSGTGASTANPQVALPGGTVTAPAAPTRTGFVFNGWRTAGPSGPLFDFATTASADITLYAAWDQLHTVTLQGGIGGTGVATPATALAGGTVTLSPLPNPGYQFQSWQAIAPAGLSITSGSFTMPAADVTVGVNFTPIPYALSYALGGGTVSSPNPTGYTLQSGAITLNNPTRTGWTFVGWQGTGISGTSTSVTIASGSIGDRSYVAVWAKTPLAVTLDNDGHGTASASANPAEPDSIVALTALPDPGYELDAWVPLIPSNLTVSGVGEFVMPWQPVTVRATFQPINYSLNYTLNGGSAVNPSTYTVESASIALSNPTRVGYTFAGWTGTGITGSSPTVTIATGSIGNRSYAATWTANSYTISYALGGGVASNPTSYTPDSGAITLANPTRSGYTFAGWTGTDITGSSPTVTIETGSIGNRSYAATWSAVTYSIDYTLNGGSAVNPSGYTPDSGAITLANPTRSGYIFAGWTGTDITGSSPSVTIPTGSIGNRSYTATWELIDYTIGYDLGGGSAANPAAYTVESPAITLTNPTRAGYTFSGWTGTDIAGSSSNVTVPTGSVGNRSFTATWSAIVYTIDYVLAGGSAVNPVTYTVASGPIVLANPTRPGYTFSGWTGTDIVGSSPSVTIETGSLGNRSFTATWSANTYTLSYDLGGGTASNPSDYTPDSWAITLVNPTRAGYTFLGWTGTDVVGPALSVTIAAGSIGNRSYVATWEPIVYTINYDLGGGLAVNPTDYTPDSAAIVLVNPTRSGYTFAGWTGTDVASPSLNVTIDTGSIGDRAFTATWQPIVYPISYVLSGGSVVNPATYTVESSPLTLASPTRAGYAFAGWTGTDVVGSSLTVTIPTGSLGARSYTAIWSAITYTISYDLGGGSGSNPTLYTPDSGPISLVNPTRAGYVFSGWTGTGLNESSRAVTIPSGSIGDRAYVATWRTPAVSPLPGPTTPTPGPTTSQTPTPKPSPTPTATSSAAPIPDSSEAPVITPSGSDATWLIVVIIGGVLLLAAAITIIIVSRRRR